MMLKRMSVLAAVLGVSVAGGATAGTGGKGTLLLGPASRTAQPTYRAYYDGHKDTYLITDVSNKAQAARWHINFAPSIGHVKGLPPQYFVQGKAAAGQLSVFGSEPGESDYNPLWEELVVTWKAGAKPVLLVKDDQIKALAKEGKLTLRDAHIVLNAPILHVGK
jgi:hypothetical protein